MKSEDNESTREVKQPASEDKSIEAEAAQELRRSKRLKTDDSAPLPGVGEAMATVAKDNIAAAGISADGSSNASGSSTSRARRRNRGVKRESSSQRGGRVRLPDKLLKYLQDEPMDGVVWWMPDGNGFAYDINKVQANFLDVHFCGTKLTSFIRSLNRWGFRRVFYHALPENVNAFYHPKFKRDHPERVKEINMAQLPKSQGDEEEVEGKDEEETPPPIQEQPSPQDPPQAQQQHLNQLARQQQRGGQSMVGQLPAAGSVAHNPQQQVQPVVMGDQQQAFIAAMLQGQLFSIAMMQQPPQQGQFPAAQQQPVVHVQQQPQAPPSAPAPISHLQIPPGMQQGQVIWQMPQPDGLQQAHDQTQPLQQQQPHTIQQMQQQPQVGRQQAPFHAPQNLQLPQYQHAQQQKPAQQFALLHPNSSQAAPTQHLSGLQGSQLLQNPHQLPQQNAPACLLQPQQLQLPQLNLAQLGGFGGQEGLHGTSGQQLQAAIQHLVQQGLLQALQQQPQVQQNRFVEQAPDADNPESNETG